MRRILYTGNLIPDSGSQCIKMSLPVTLSQGLYSYLKALSFTRHSILPTLAASGIPFRLQVGFLTLLLMASTPALAQNEGRWKAGFENGFGARAAAIPGGIAIVDVGPTRLPTPEVSFGKKKVLVQKNAGRWIAVVGIPLSTKPGTYTLDIFSTVARQSTFRVNAKNYPEQRLTIKNKRKVNPNPDDIKRIAGESKRMAKAKSTWSENFQAGPFIVPSNGVVSSPFGLRRVYNNQPRRPHAGLDIAAPEGTPIRAASNGIVIEAGDFFFNGKSVFLDHGNGLLSLYSHMSKILVDVGQAVESGELIGEVGQTGRVTGPHLHWSVGLNGTWVDPSLLLPPETTVQPLPAAE